MNAIALPARLTRHGYMAVPHSRVPACRGPLDGSSLRVTHRWVAGCFVPAYRRARQVWGDNEQAIAAEIIEDVLPQMSVGDPRTGPEHELRRRVNVAVAALLNEAGVPVPYPPPPRTPRPQSLPHAPSWYRALLTGWAR